MPVSWLCRGGRGRGAAVYSLCGRGGTFSLAARSVASSFCARESLRTAWACRVGWVRWVVRRVSWVTQVGFGVS